MIDDEEEGEMCPWYLVGEEVCRLCSKYLTEDDVVSYMGGIYRRNAGLKYVVHAICKQGWS